MLILLSTGLPNSSAEPADTLGEDEFDESFGLPGYGTAGVMVDDFGPSAMAPPVAKRKRDGEFAFGDMSAFDAENTNVNDLISGGDLLDDDPLMKRQRRDSTANANELISFDDDDE